MVWEEPTRWSRGWQRYSSEGGENSTGRAPRTYHPLQSLLLLYRTQTLGLLGDLTPHSTKLHPVCIPGPPLPNHPLQKFTGLRVNHDGLHSQRDTLRATTECFLMEKWKLYEGVIFTKHSQESSAFMGEVSAPSPNFSSSFYLFNNMVDLCETQLEKQLLLKKIIALNLKSSMQNVFQMVMAL